LSPEIFLNEKVDGFILPEDNILPDAKARKVKLLRGLRAGRVIQRLHGNRGDPDEIFARRRANN
jgi:hypothetical protein